MKESKSVVSSLNLERFLYYNSVFAPMFGVILIFQCIYRQFYFVQLPKGAIIGPVFCISWSLLEVLRLRIGGHGNKFENVSGSSAEELSSLSTTPPSSSPGLSPLSFFCQPFPKPPTPHLHLPHTNPLI